MNSSVKIACQIIQDWMSKQVGFIKWEIHNIADGTYIDIVSWESKDAAKKAEKEMMNIPNAMDWFSCYKEGSISSKNLALVASFE